MTLRCGKQLPAPVVVYLLTREALTRMPSANRATKMPVAVAEAPGPIGRSGSGLDLAARLRTSQRRLRTRVERRDALIDVVRAVNATLEPPKIADAVIDRAAAWIPATSWALAATDLSGSVSVLADRGLTPEMGPAVGAVPAWAVDPGP